MASRRPSPAGTRGGGVEKSAGRLPMMVDALPSRQSPANDNKAPLLLRLRRLVLFAMAALAVGWLFWVGLLR